MAHTDGSDETILYADIDPEHARNKHIVNIPGTYEIHRSADRRPEMYSSITNKKTQL